MTLPTSQAHDGSIHCPAALQQAHPSWKTFKMTAAHVFFLHPLSSAFLFAVHIHLSFTTCQNGGCLPTLCLRSDSLSFDPWSDGSRQVRGKRETADVLLPPVAAKEIQTRTYPHYKLFKKAAMSQLFLRHPPAFCRSFGSPPLYSYKNPLKSPTFKDKHKHITLVLHIQKGLAFCH